MPFIWSWLSPVFKVVAGWIIAGQALTGMPWLYYLISLGFGVRLALAPLMVRQMVVINKMSQAGPGMRVVAQLFKHSKLGLFSRGKAAALSCYAMARETKVNLLAFYFYNLVQLPVFVIMVMSIRKVSHEHDALTGAGIWWFKDLNAADPYMILPLVATALNYYNLGHGINKENEKWLINRFRSFFQVLQFLHLPFTHVWPAGSFVYWIASSSFVLLQNRLMRKPWVM